jgi:thioredoxin 1
MIEELNRLESELREMRVQEFAGMLPQLEGQPELQKACLQEAVRFPPRQPNLSGCKLSSQKRGKILACQNFAPGSKRLENVAGHCPAMGCNSKSSLARQLLYQQQNNENMNTKQAQEINEPEFDTEVLRCPRPVVVGFLAGWSKPSRLVEPVLDEVAGACDGNAKVLKVNVDDNPDLGTIYAVQSVPTLIYFFKGAVRAKIVGMVSPKAILAKLNSLTPGKPPTQEFGRPQ